MSAITSITEAKDELIAFVVTIDIEYIEDDWDSLNWDISSKIIKLKKHEITYALLRKQIEQAYPYLVECLLYPDEDEDEEFEWDIYDQIDEQKITNDETLIKLINSTTHKDQQIDLTVLIKYPWQPIVIDNGSYFLKAGFGGDDAPRAVFPTIVGRSKWSGGTSVWLIMAQKDAYVGDEAQSKRGILSLKYPIYPQRQISSFDDMEKVWHHTFYNELRIQFMPPEQHKVLLTDSVFNKKSNRERMTNIMFQTFNVEALYIAYQPVLALIEAGRKHGIVLDSGWNTTECVPIYDGKVISEGIMVSNFGGQHIIDYLCKLLNNKGGGSYSVTTSAEREIARDIKEKLCYVKFRNIDVDFDNKFYNCSKNYEWPDGYVMEITDEERYMPVESLFNPKLIGKDDENGIHELILKSIGKCNGNIRSELFNNILLCGGNTMFRGIKERLKYELENIKNNNEIVVNGYIRRYNKNKLLYNDIMNLLYEYSTINVNVIASPERKYSVWIGGSILTNRGTFEDKWITKDEYDEFGPAIVHKKCHTVSEN